MILPPSKIKRDHLSGQTMSPSPKPMKYVIYKSYLPFPFCNRQKVLDIDDKTETINAPHKHF